MADLKLGLVIEAIDRFSGVFKGLRKEEGAAVQGALTGNKSLVSSLGDVAASYGAVAKAPAAVGDAVAAAEVASVGSLRRMGSRLKSFGSSLRESFSFGNLRQGGAQAFEQVNGMGERLAGMVGGALAVRDVMKDRDFWDRMRITSGKSREEIDALSGSVKTTAAAWGVGTEEIMAGMFAMKEAGRSTEFFQENLKSLGIEIQNMNGHGEELGVLFGNLSRSMKITGPNDLLSAVSTTRQQLKGIPDAFSTFADAAKYLMPSYSGLKTGSDGAKGLAAIFGTIASSAKGPRPAVSDVAQFIQAIQAKGRDDYVPWLKAGVHISTGPAAYRRGERRDPVAILRDLLTRYQTHKGKQAIDQNLPWFAEMFKSATDDPGLLDRLLSPKGDPANEEQLAGELKNTMFGVLKQIGGELKQTGDTMLSGPLEALKNVLVQYKGAVTGILTGLVALSAVGIGLTWLKFAWNAASTLLMLGPLTKLVARGLTAAFGIEAATAGGVMMKGIGLGMRGGGRLLLAGLGSILDLTLLGSLFAGVGTFFAGLFSLPVLAIVAAVAAIGAAAYLIYQYWGPIKAWFGSLWDGIKDAASRWADWMGQRIRQVANDIKNLDWTPKPWAPPGSTSDPAVSGRQTNEQTVATPEKTDEQRAWEIAGTGTDGVFQPLAPLLELGGALRDLTQAIRPRALPTATAAGMLVGGMGLGTPPAFAANEAFRPAPSFIAPSGTITIKFDNAPPGLSVTGQSDSGGHWLNIDPAFGPTHQSF